MTATFQKTSATITRGRGSKPIPDDVLNAVDAAIKGKTNVAATVSAAEGKRLQNDFNRLRRRDPSLSYTVSVKPGDKEGTVVVLLADVKRAT